METQKARRSSTSIATVGSSRISRSGSGMIASAYRSRWAWAPGQLLGPGAEEAPQLRPPDHLHQRQRMTVQPAHQFQHLAHRCPVQQGPGLQHRAHPASLDGRRRLHAEHPHLTGVRPDQSKDEFGGGGLPSPVWVRARPRSHRE